MKNTLYIGNLIVDVDSIASVELKDATSTIEISLQNGKAFVIQAKDSPTLKHAFESIKSSIKDSSNGSTYINL